MNRTDTINAADLSLLIGRIRVAHSKQDRDLIEHAAVAIAAAHEHYITCGLGRRADVVVRFVRRLARRWAAVEGDR